MKILIIDDEKDFGESLKEGLEISGDHSVSYLDSALDAERKASYQQADVVLLDLRMSRLTGEEFIMKLRSGEVEDVKPIIVISGIVSEESSLPFEPPVKVLPKPVNLARLLDCLDEVANQSSQA